MLAEFSDPRLVAIYDSVNAYGPGEQPDFYRGLATEIGAGHDSRRRVRNWSCHV